MVEERVVDHAKDRALLVDETDRYAGEGKAMDKVCGPICRIR